MTKQLRGVNLGGWLVTEKWMTPSLYVGTDAVDEYTLSRHKNGHKRLEQHRKSFITEEDFIWLKNHEITLVRIPVGYWLFDSVDGYSAAKKYLDLAMAWAEKHGIQVLLCMHGAKGSQNGFDNSGRAGDIGWFEDTANQKDTLAFLERLAEEYKNSSALWGIELLNEPKPGRHYFTLLRFYRAAYRMLTKIVKPGTRIIFHDAFQPLLFTGSLWQKKSHPIMMDIHWYGFEFNNKDFSAYLHKSSLVRKWVLRIVQLWQPAIVGEWSTVLPQRFFNEAPKAKHMDLLKQNADMQEDAYKRAAGWFYWNYKVEGVGMWNFRDLVEKHIIEI